MASLARTLAILTLPAAAVGALGGLALRAIYDVPSEPPAPPSHGSPGAEPVTTDDVRGERPTRSVRPPRPSRHGTGGEVVPKLDPSFGLRLSDPDEKVRLACALQLLELGPPWEAVDRLPVSGDPGTKLRDGIVNALEALGRVRRAEDYARSPEGSKLQVRLKYFGGVVPDALLVKDRRRYWELCVQGDARRTADGTVRPGEAAWHALELARAKRELGEIKDEEWSRLRDASIRDVRAWVTELSERKDVARDVVKTVEEALARIEAVR